MRTKKCVICAQEFRYRRSTARYCSKTCIQLAVVQRKKSDYYADRMVYRVERMVASFKNKEDEKLQRYLEKILYKVAKIFAETNGWESPGQDWIIVLDDNGNNLFLEIRENEIRR